MRHIKQTLALSLLLAGAGLGFLLLYTLISRNLSASSGIVLAILVLVQQLYILIRILLRLTRYSSQMQLFRVLAARGETETQGEPRL